MRYIKRSLLLFFAVVFYLSVLIAPQKIKAIVDPMSSQNNKFGVHILFTTELEDAAKLVNTNGGDWGYVTIPIQAGDKDLEKWQRFMDAAREYHIIPIIRLATENYYFDTTVWRKPNFADVLDFANFLDSLEWPIMNRYIVIFNEPNRGDEWGGVPSPYEYAHILSYAVETFKFKNSDFFIISAGFDNASENNEYTFMQEMYSAVPKVFNKVDAIGSHSYPNPGFDKPPWIISRKSISSFIYEKRLAELLGDKELPVFITETGWSSSTISKSQIGRYFTEAFDSVWATDDIVAVTPFLLNAGTGPFAQFSLINNNGEKNEIYNAIFDIPKTLGNPKLPKAKTMDQEHLSNDALPTKDFTSYKEFDNSAVKNKVLAAVELVRWILRL